MHLPIYYVGTAAEVEHHARPLMTSFDVRIESPKEVFRHAVAGDVCLFYNEFFPHYRQLNHELVRRQCPTLYALDGILEWRNSWEFPASAACPWSLRPVLSHKVACIGSSQARTLEAWGNTGKCEVVGLPRLDGLLGRKARRRNPSEPFTILVLTAKCPGFNDDQLRRTARSLLDFKAWLDAHKSLHGTAIRSIWRITQGLEKTVAVDNSLRDTTGQDLAAALSSVDAVVTTASTAMLEGMLQGIPVALLDYHNCPHYVPAAWRITAGEHFDQVIPELLNPPLSKMDYQRFILGDALECNTPALPRLEELIQEMHLIAQQHLGAGLPLSFPHRILSSRGGTISTRAIPWDHARLFPQNPAFNEPDVRRLQAELGDYCVLNARLETAQEDFKNQLEVLLRDVEVLRARERSSFSARLRRLKAKAVKLAQSLMARKTHAPHNRRVA